jgi:two-component system, cell cycle sensor histidine kinase and response regulator CckA
MLHSFAHAQVPSPQCVARQRARVTVFPDLIRRSRWPWRLGLAVLSMASALLLTHALWPFLKHTPFLLGFAAAVVSARIGGRIAGFASVIIGAVLYGFFPPPLPATGFPVLLTGFVAISGSFSWLVARRYEVESALRASQQRLGAVISGFPIVLWVMNADGCLTLAEGSGLRALNLRSRDLVGRSVFELYGDHPEIIRNARRVLAGETFTAVSVLGQVAVETWYSPVRDRENAVTGAIGVSLDVTTRHRLEEQYRQSQRMDAVGQLAAGIAHDFNNLLTAIVGYTEMVFLTLDAGDERRDELQEVTKAAQRAAALTRQLLAFSRRQVLQPTVLDVNALVGDVQKLLRRTIPENIDLQLELSHVDPVRADGGQLEQVLLNLAINAGDAMPHGGDLRIVTATVDVDDALAHRRFPMPAGRYVRLTVSDTGSGMTPEVQARIFEPFFSTKERGKGTGLGLATVYGIVKQSGGYIWVDSHAGHGTTFEIYLPPVQAPLELVEQAPPTAHAMGGSQTVLVAEDDGAVRRLTRDILTRHGYVVLEARDGDEALTLARHHAAPIHLLIADVVMPGLSGRELAERLRVDRPDIRVLYTSGYTENMMVRAGFERVETELSLLTKPFLPVDLLRTVVETLAG